LPVIDNGLVKGSITDKKLISLDASAMRMKVRDIMERKFPVVDPDTKLETLSYLLHEYAAVLVDRGGRQYGIVTKHDLLRATAVK
jgi:predicted transcriptional regulator